MSPRAVPEVAGPGGRRCGGAAQGRGPRELVAALRLVPGLLRRRGPGGPKAKALGVRARARASMRVRVRVRVRARARV